MASASSHNVGKLQSVCMGPTAGSLTQASCAAGYYSESETYDYDARLPQQSITIPSSGTFTYTWTYGVTGMPSTVTYPTSTSGKALQLQYGYQNGFLASITDALDSNNMVWQANAVNAAGQITQETLGNSTSGNIPVIETRTYDAVTHWISAITAGANGGGGLQNQSFLYDELGNFTQRQDNNLGLTENIYYDNLYRFNSSKLNGTANLSVSYGPTGEYHLPQRHCRRGVLAI